MRALGFSRPPLARRELGLPAPLTLPWLRLSLSLSHARAPPSNPGLLPLPPSAAPGPTSERPAGGTPTTSDAERTSSSAEEEEDDDDGVDISAERKTGKGRQAAGDDSSEEEDDDEEEVSPRC
jgi:hypothetical protein